MKSAHLKIRKCRGPRFFLRKEHESLLELLHQLRIKTCNHNIFYIYKKDNYPCGSAKEERRVILTLSKSKIQKSRSEFLKPSSQCLFQTI